MYLPALLIAVMIMLFSGCASTTAAKNSSPKISPPPVVLDSSQMFEIYSPSKHQNYRIRVRLPASYESNLDKHYPVVIKLDGQWDFLLAASAFNCIYFDGQMPETIFVGIDWGDVEGDIHAIRSRDLLPAPHSGYPESGKAKAFVNAIVQEIVPQLENRFRLNGQRFLLGTSWSALFASYALLEQPDAFDGAIAIAGDYGAGGEAIHQQIIKLKGSNTLKGKRLYIGIGKFDQVAPSVLNYAKELEAANLEGFHLKVNYLDGFGHSGMNIPGYAGGYQFIFERPDLALPIKTLSRLTGVYTSATGEKLVINTDADGLTATPAMGQTIALKAKSENEFYHPGQFFNLTLQGTQAQVETFFGQFVYERSSPL